MILGFYTGIFFAFLADCIDFIVGVLKEQTSYAQVADLREATLGNADLSKKLASVLTA